VSAPSPFATRRRKTKRPTSVEPSTIRRDRVLLAVLAAIGPHLLAVSKAVPVPGDGPDSRLPEPVSHLRAVRRAIDAALAKLGAGAEGEALSLERLAPRDRARLRKALPALLEPGVRLAKLAAATANEPVGALGHLAFAREEISRVLDRALALAAK
jgi:hypothetical protein